MPPHRTSWTDPRPASRRRGLATLAALALVGAASGCTNGSQAPDDGATSAPSEESAAPAAQAAALEGVQTLDAPDPAALALAASTTFFDAAPVVVLVEGDASRAEGDASRAEGDAAALAVAAAAAEEVTGPVLVTGGSVPDAELADELERLGAIAVVGVGTGDAGTGGSGEETAEQSDGESPDETDAAPLDLGDVDVVELDPAELTAAGDDGATTVDDAALAAALEDLPATGAPEPAPGALALTDPDAGGAPLAAATARASGAEVVAVPGGDPRATTAAVEAVSQAQAGAVVGLGATFGSGEDLAWRVETARSGVELPGGGQIALPGKRYVALYGSPVTPALGVLGEQGVAETIARAQEHAAMYEGLTDEPVVPTLEIIVTVASGSAGDDGNYSNEWSVDTFRPLVDAAGEAGVYVVLDFQPGRTDFVTQIRQYEELVALPHVGVALDPEWRLEPDEVHLRQIGSVGIDEVNAVADYLAQLTRERALPQKILVLHQFRLDMIPGRERLDTTHPELAVLIHADGQGSQGAKAGTWAALHADAPAGVFWGWKNFYDEDVPMLTPEQTFAVQPTPDFVSYQ